MYLLFREYHLLPSAVMKLGYGERQVLYAFIRYEMEEREKNKQATKECSLLVFLLLADICCGRTRADFDDIALFYQTGQSAFYRSLADIRAAFHKILFADFP